MGGVDALQSELLLNGWVREAGVKIQACRCMQWFDQTVGHLSHDAAA